MVSTNMVDVTKEAKAIADEAERQRRREEYETLCADGNVHIFTDGSAATKDRSGGWGAVLRMGDYERRISGGVADTSIGAMELLAILEALKCIKHFDDKVIVYSDSQYSVNAVTLWWRGWKHRGWLTTQGKPVKNVDLIQDILAISNGNPVAFRWIKGHAGNHGNEIADKLAGTARRELLMLQDYKEKVTAMANNNSVPIGIEQWKMIADRHVKGLEDINEHEKGWACKHPIMLWTYYLATSYLYYEEDKSLIPDIEFDNLCKYLLLLGKDKLVESGAYWVDKLYDESALEAGTGYHLCKKIPIGVQNIAITMTQAMHYREAVITTNPAAYLKVVEPKRRTRTRQAVEKPKARTRTRSRKEPEEVVSAAPKRRRRQRT